MPVMGWLFEPMIVNEYGLFGSPVHVTVKLNVAVEPVGASFVTVRLPGAGASRNVMTVGPEVPTGIVNDWVLSPGGGSWNPGGAAVSVTVHVDPEGPTMAIVPVVATTEMAP